MYLKKKKNNGILKFIYFSLFFFLTKLSEAKWAILKDTHRYTVTTIINIMVS